MKILWLSHNVPYPPIGGVLQRNYHLLRRIAARAEVHLVALQQRAICPDGEPLELAKRELGGFCASVRVFPIDWELSLTRRLAESVPIALGLKAYDLARFHSGAAHRHLGGGSLPPVDVLHVDTLGLIPYRAHLRQLPAVLNHHNIESHMMARRAGRGAGAAAALVMRAQARSLRRLEERQAPGFDNNLVVSELDGVRLREIAPRCNVAVIPNGVDIGYFDGPPQREPLNRTAIFVGGLGWYPNQDAVTYFLESIWPAIARREPQAEFVVIGRGPSRRMREIAAGDPRVRLLGFVDDIRAEVARAAVFVCPFRLGGGSRLKVLDALAMRKAMVATGMGAEGIPMKDGEHYLRGDKPESFAEQVVGLFHDPQLRARLGEAGRRFVEERFDWDKIGGRLSEVYEEVVRAPAPRDAPLTRTPRM